MYSPTSRSNPSLLAYSTRVFSVKSSIPRFNTRQLISHNNGADQPAVSEFVRKREGEALVAVVSGHLMHLILSIADGAQVELVAALGQLGDPRRVESVEAAHIAHHLQRCEEGIHVRERTCGIGPFLRAELLWWYCDGNFERE